MLDTILCLSEKRTRVKESAMKTEVENEDEMLHIRSSGPQIFWYSSSLHFKQKVLICHSWYYLTFLKNSITKATHKFLEYIVFYKKNYKQMITWSVLLRIVVTRDSRNREKQTKRICRRRERWKTGTGRVKNCDRVDG